MHIYAAKLRLCARTSTFCLKLRFVTKTHTICYYTIRVRTDGRRGGGCHGNNTNLKHKERPCGWFEKVLKAIVCMDMQCDVLYEYFAH